MPFLLKTKIVKVSWKGGGGVVKKPSVGREG